MVITTVFEESPLMRAQRLAFGERPLHSPFAIEHGVAVDAGDVAGLAARQLFQNLKHLLGTAPAPKNIENAPCFGHQPKDAEVAERLAWRKRHLLGQPDAALGIDERAFLFAPS